jgi:hypothetical protein
MLKNQLKMPFGTILSSGASGICGMLHPHAVSGLVNLSSLKQLVCAPQTLVFSKAVPAVKKSPQILLTVVAVDDVEHVEEAPENMF